MQGWRRGLIRYVITDNCCFSITRTLAIVSFGFLALSCSSEEASITSNYQQQPENSARVNCNYINIETFRRDSRRFAESQGLHYQEEVSNIEGTLFVITIRNERSLFWLGPDSSNLRVSQFLSSGVTASENDVDQFQNLITVLQSCGRNSSPAR